MGLQSHCLLLGWNERATFAMEQMELYLNDINAAMRAFNEKLCQIAGGILHFIEITLNDFIAGARDDMDITADSTAHHLGYTYSVNGTY